MNQNLQKLTKAQLIEQVQELQRWRDAVDDAMRSAGLGALQPGTSPVLAMDWVIHQHLEVAERERIEPLTDWQISQLELNCKSRIGVVREVERALGVVPPGEELLRVSVPTKIPDAARQLLAGAAGGIHGEGGDALQLLWDALLHAGGAIEPVVPDSQKPRQLDWIKARPKISTPAGFKKIKLADHLADCK